jgi:hypothetical protein
VAVGGNGAPLISFFDYLFLRPKGEPLSRIQQQTDTQLSQELLGLLFKTLEVRSCFKFYVVIVVLNELLRNRKRHVSSTTWVKRSTTRVRHWSWKRSH